MTSSKQYNTKNIERLKIYQTCWLAYTNWYLYKEQAQEHEISGIHVEYWCQGFSPECVTTSGFLNFCHRYDILIYAW